MTPSDALGSSYPKILNSIVTPQIISTLKKYGMTINEGVTPPTLDGEFYLHDNLILYQTGGLVAGTYAQSETYKFSNQDNNKFTIDVKYTNGDGSDKGADSTYTYICGNGRLFTVFAVIIGKLNGISYKNLAVYSGEIIANTAIKNFKIAIFVMSKSADPGDRVIVPIGTIGISEEAHGTSDFLPPNSWQYVNF